MDQPKFCCFVWEIKSGWELCLKIKDEALTVVFSLKYLWDLSVFTERNKQFVQIYKNIKYIYILLTIFTNINIIQE